MQSRKSALKHMKADETKRLRNARVTSSIKTLVNKFNRLLKKGQKEDARKLLPKVSSALDKAAKRGIIHKNMANRKKARLARRLTA
jgi:small subunit ribosomal protein S20